jgi:hypothetical protein
MHGLCSVRFTAGDPFSEDMKKFHRSFCIVSKVPSQDSFGEVLDMLIGSNLFISGFKRKSTLGVNLHELTSCG